MKVIQFTIPVAKDNTLTVQEDVLPHFYHHLHRHNEAQITWIIAGTGSLMAGNYMQPFHAGDVYFIGPNQPHLFKSDASYFENKNKHRVHALTFFFDPLGSFSTLLLLPEMKPLNKFIQQASFGLKLPENAQKKVTEEMIKVKQSRKVYRLAAFLHLLQVMADTKGWKTISSIPAADTFSDNEGLRMNSVYQFTMNNFSETISLKQVADVANMTPHAFCRYFKKHTRKTYIGFLNEVRINEACKLLLTDKASSIASVAYSVGYANPVSFNRVFKTILGRSPKKYVSDFEAEVDE